MSPIKPAVINKLVEIQNNWCLLGQRVLMICKKKCNLNSIFETDSSVGELEKYIHKSEDFCIIGLVGIIDPPREGISEVIATCRKAGIRVLMVTGDYALTAAAIAAQIGILTQPQYDTAESMRVKHKEGGSGGEKKSLLLTGNDLDTMDENDWRIITQYEEIVLARTTPEQKLRTVKEFQADEYIVGVTGDGVNDAPALKSANIGIAMGSGSEVAMEASQLVLLDSNFSSILVAIENGRLVFENLRKVILYLLPAGSMGELVPVLMSIFIGVQCNLSAFAMILIALFTDMAPSMAIMKEQPEIDLLALKPRTKKDHLTDWRFIIQAYCFMGVMVVFFSQTMFFIYMKMALNMDAGQILLAFDKLASNYNDSNWMILKDMPNYNYTSSTDLTNYFNTQFYTAQTVTFTSLVMLQIFGNLISTRTHKKSFFQQPPWKRGKLNLWVFAAQCCSLCIMVIVVYVPAFQYLFQTGPVPVQFIFMPLCFCLVIFTLDELRKLAVRRNFLCFGKIGW
jgi:sodium/potassium-transporting ATPase subunit alpha